MALLIQRQAGGNLSEVLERLAALVRSRLRLRQHVRTLTAEGRLQGLTLVVLPFVMYAAMYLLNRPYAAGLLEHPALLCGTGAVDAHRRPVDPTNRQHGRMSNPPMSSDSAITPTVAFLVVFAGLAAAGYPLTRRRGGRLAARLRPLAACVHPVRRGGLARNRNCSVPPEPPDAGRGLRHAAAWPDSAAQCLQAGFFYSHAPALFVTAQALLMLTLAAGSAAAAFYALPSSNGPPSSHATFGGLPFGVKVGRLLPSPAAPPAFWLRRSGCRRRCTADNGRCGTPCRTPWTCWCYAWKAG